MTVRLLIVFCMAFAVLVVIYSGLRVFSGFAHGYSWEEMDWNQDGTTTWIEVVEASDVGRRNVDGMPCIEYFAYKDGLAIRLDCRLNAGDL
ncbi:hypothetical protein AGMMS49543_20300 [Betaproteobacteria bacterium]|nr:hypothetical protein AGMMS49543_20300 [Betaproteobacteria bacterium]GHU20186.1 hypothetical protein AGMMS50243_14080 [Betaproteobacteria bacterium]